MRVSHLKMGDLRDLCVTGKHAKVPPKSCPKIALSGGVKACSQKLCVVQRIPEGYRGLGAVSLS